MNENQRRQRHGDPRLPPADSLDRKFYGIIYKAKDGSLVLPNQFVVFLAKDNAFAAILPYYVEKCRELGADAEQIAGAEALLARVEAWRREHPDQCKVPDAAGERMLGENSG